MRKANRITRDATDQVRFLVKTFLASQPAPAERPRVVERVLSLLGLQESFLADQNNAAFACNGANWNPLAFHLSKPKHIGSWPAPETMLDLLSYLFRHPDFKAFKKRAREDFLARISQEHRRIFDWADFSSALSEIALLKWISKCRELQCHLRERARRSKTSDIRVTCSGVDVLVEAKMQFSRQDQTSISNPEAMFGSVAARGDIAKRIWQNIEHKIVEGQVSTSVPSVLLIDVTFVNDVYFCFGYPALINAFVSSVARQRPANQTSGVPAFLYFLSNHAQGVEWVRSLE
ncbi:MAG: hypothetical protein HYY84_16200 [Deltaproteobacteria bacterium]|nr:hypothetical protein [Deltaproteobacteria bacterium]